MAAPLLAGSRVELQYNVVIGTQTLTHKRQMYGKLLDAGEGVTPRFRWIDRGGNSTTDWQLFVSHFASLMADLFPTGMSVGYTAELQNLVSSEWLPLDNFSGTITGSFGSGSVGPAIQVTATWKDTAFRIIRDPLFETVFSSIVKVRALGSITVPAQNYYKGWTSAGADPLDPFQWVVSRSNLYISDNSFRGLSVYPNKKLVRRRGL